MSISPVVTFIKIFTVFTSFLSSTFFISLILLFLLPPKWIPKFTIDFFPASSFLFKRFSKVVVVGTVFGMS